MIRVCIAGLGKTGKEIAGALFEEDGIKLVGAICSASSAKKGKDLGEVIGKSKTGIIVNSAKDIEQVVFKTKPDVVVDFSSPEAALRNAVIFSKMRVNIVIGTTGFSKIALKKLFVLTRKYRNGIVYAPNITLGVNVLMLLTNLASNLLNNYDFQITEIHHKNKKDSPSGTAIKIAREIEKGLKSSGRKENAINVPISSVRAGGVIGKHEVMIVGEEDKIEISHESFSRKAFAAGAVKAVKFVRGKSGYFEMSDVLNLKKVLSDYVEKESVATNKRHNRYGADDEIEDSQIVL
ncbi:dihydrodipicolinate reductase [Anaerobacterium chartisolvens]|uniref:4-hydroxy-tetrahydrodipicolinate reductase n=1 Tax=Anaerobacterium chartisolvens TaxID=1297424 RepID=A0A369BBM9_9FIRM|nr:4-hydroxy-tetrahydrodipicolinate reductase [Anaerobacterium chartisolvens]RCX18933.1 dihydrodipicolinate reductase [Anaerobacterium chartisolvens]